MLEPWQKAWVKSRDNPWLFATGVLDFLPADAEPVEGRPQLEAWQDKFLRDFMTGPDGKPTLEPRHSVRSGHGTGKTTVIAILALWFVTTHYDSKCVVTAASQDQLRDGAWSEIRKWMSALPEALRSQLEAGEERVTIRAAPEMAFVVRRTASKANPQALAGIHAKHVLYLIDEASGIEDVIFETAAGSLSTHGAMAAIFSNPTKANGFFFDTHNKMRSRWHTWVVSSEDVPRARGHIEDIIAAYGRNSNKYRVRVLGEFPTADDDTVIPLELIEAARGRDVTRLNFVPVWGVDVGRFGDDTSALAKRQGNALLEPVKEWHGKDSVQLAAIVLNEYRATHEDHRPREILVDEIGIGAGVVDQMRVLGLPVRGVNVAEAPSADDRYMRLRDELWFKGREWFEDRACTIPDDAKLIAELAGPTYDFSATGKIVVEPKKEMKKRGLASPNKADAFLLTFAGGMERPVTVRRRASSNRPAWAV